MDAVREFIEGLPSVDKVGSSWFSNAVANVILGIFCLIAIIPALAGLGVMISSAVASFTAGN